MGGPKAIQGSLKEEGKRFRVREGDVMIEAEVRVTWKMEDTEDGRGALTKKCRYPLEAGESKETDSPLEPPKEYSPSTLDFSPMRPILDF